ncbi:sigma 54-interacting transcriptional regulator [Dehalobacter sp. DCM]|uniref:sigma-54 interaction domain-containing protein n=1 Tax=Dehalobacter sp. DCM TaxID=2907827 RepID=UPI003081648A|nr:sigma 54-interacting transcriptional regulator [Dehalobacter sp. DCM]
MVNHPSHYYASKEYWEEVERCKRQFVDKGENPLASGVVRKEIAESWMRSKQYGVKLDTNHLNYSLSEAELLKMKEKNKLLLDLSMPLIQNFLDLAAASGHSLELFDPNGVFLSGIHIDITKTNVKGTIWNEKTTGTTSHTMAISQKKPYQIIGPENYLEILHNTISTSAPIINGDGMVLGALALVQVFPEKPWKKDIAEMYSQALGWVTSLVMAIEKQIELHRNSESLRVVNDVLNTTLEFIDEGIVSIESDGSIIRANKEAGRILHCGNNSLDGRNIFEYFNKNTRIKEYVIGKRNAEFLEENVKCGHDEKPYLVSIKPVIRQDNDSSDITILRLVNTDKINALVTNRTGAVAKFNFNDIVGESESMNRAKRLAHRFAGSQENVLLLGESGTGKEIFAQAMHNQYRPNGPFIAVNCAAMPRNLIESELFGYEAGAFTGAEKHGRPGKIELANGGTLFLDEIGDMPYELQAVLLRVLQDKMVMRLGGNKYRQVNFRLIAATNQDLLTMIKDKVFREDLYFRLSVLNIEIPPLRERGNDIFLLTEYFIRQYSQRMGWKVSGITEAAKSKLLKYDWPGNVRQLENAIIYAVNVAEEQDIDLSHLPKELQLMAEDKAGVVVSANEMQDTQDGSDSAEDPMFSMKESEKQVLLRTMSKSGYNIGVAANFLGISKTTLYRKLKEHKISTKYPR